MSELITPKTLTNAMIRQRRVKLSLEISRLQRERYDCVLALGGDALHEGADTQDSAARQRICDSINASTGCAK